jgi:DNA-binding NarL/FixJ family response regulator
MTASLGRGSDGIGVVIVEPVGIVRTGLRSLFAAEPSFEVLGEAGGAADVLQIVESIKTHLRVVVLVALELDEDACSLMRAIRDRWPNLVLLATGTDLNHGVLSQALFAGADGFVHRNSPPERYVEAARRAVAGELVLEGLPRGALGEIVEGIDQQRSASTLTAREQMVLVAAADGLTAREIGRRLGVRERTITSHLNNIYRKLGANGRVAALSTAWRMGMISLPGDVVMSSGQLGRLAG